MLIFGDVLKLCSYHPALYQEALNVQSKWGENVQIPAKTEISG